MGRLGVRGMGCDWDCVIAEAYCQYIDVGLNTAPYQLWRSKFTIFNSYSSVVPRLIEDMVSMSPDTLPLEDLREAQVLWHLVFGDDIVGTFWLAHDEFAD